MADSEERRSFPRPWEELAGGAGDAIPEEAPSPPPPAGVPWPPELDDLVGPEPADADAFSSDDYLAATTREYRRLAEDVARMRDTEVERLAVAASMPGVGSGLIGFDDVTGRTTPSEADVEAAVQQRANDLTVRVVSAVVLVGLFLGSLFLGGVWFSVFVGLTMLLSLGELYTTMRSRGHAPVVLFGLLGVVGVAVAAHVAGPAAIAGVDAGAAVVIGLFYAVVPRRDPLENSTLTLLGLGWVSLLAFGILLARDGGPALVVLVVLAAAVFDVAAYFVGRSVGRRPLAPRVSPRKTVEGLVGGILGTVATMVVASFVSFFDPLDLTGALALAVVVSVFAPLGDAAESVVKRALGAKDMGSLIPGHGGVFDRVDALVFVVPAAYVLFGALGYL